MANIQANALIQSLMGFLSIIVMMKIKIACMNVNNKSRVLEDYPQMLELFWLTLKIQIHIVKLGLMALEHLIKVISLRNGRVSSGDFLLTLAFSRVNKMKIEIMAKQRPDLSSNMT